VPSFQNQLSQATLLGNERLVLDLSGVSFVGSAALRVILVTAKTWRVRWAAGGVRSAAARGEAGRVIWAARAYP
jgi:hypothetical protein